MIEFILGLSPGLLVASVIIAFIALVSQMALYAKAGQPPLAALVPVWNVIIFCKVVGRPAKHALLLIVPGLVMAGAVAAYWPVIDGLFPVHGQGGELVAGPSSFSDAMIPFIIIGVAMIPLGYIIVVMFTEVCDSFGKHKTIDKVLCVFFNGAYILFVLGISDALYESPWWARKRGLPYYMPDFKHKGKKYLVTPEGPLEGDWKEQKLKVAIVDEEADPLHAEEGVKQEAVAAKDSKPAAKETVKETVKDKGADKKAEAVKKPEAKKDAPKADASKTETTKADASKKDEKPKKDEFKPSTGSSGKTWREETLEKYKKKK